MARGDRIRLDFTVGDKRYRPTVNLTPTTTNLRSEAKHLYAIKQRIKNGTFDFAAEFPDYVFLGEVAPTARAVTFGGLADDFLASCGGLEHATRESYRKILAHHWRPEFGEKVFIDIRYSDLAAFIGRHKWGSNKTRNNVVSVVRRVFDFGYADVEHKRNPAEKLKALRVQKPQPDPYTIDEAEAVINGIRKDWGESAGNYAEFSFFAGTRPSELIALAWADIDLGRGTARIEKARVMGRDKRKTKTSVVRDIELCPRALACIERQRAISQLAGGAVFVDVDVGGKAFHDLQTPWRRWQATHKRLGIRHREPYRARHTSVSWNLMIGKNLLWVAEQHGHSAAVMLKTYAKWLKGSGEQEVAAIRRAMGLDTSKEKTA
jgi:integrase